MITLDHVRDRIERPLTPHEERTTPKWIADAETVLRNAVPDLDERMSLDPAAPRHLALDTVELVMFRMVERKLRNPQGLRSFNIDGYDQTIDRDLSAGKIYLSDDDLADLAPRPIAGHHGGAFSLQVTL